MRIKNALVYEENGKFKKRDVCVTGDLFASYAAGEEIDAQGLYLIPGLIDIHIHGAVGKDFSDGDADGLHKICEYEALNGVTTIVPTTMSLAKGDLVNIMSNVVPETVEVDITKMFAPSKTGAKIAGINMEGPFINPVKKGAQNEENIIKPDIELFRQLDELTHGMIKLVDVAPEIEGAEELIREISKTTKVSLAHTDATYDEALKAFSWGASHVTHLYNAMKPFNHREPGLVGAAVDNDKVVVELIADGVHVAPSMIRTTYKMFDAKRIALISDSMRAAGISDGEYSLGGQKVIVSGNKATLGNGTIAGSVTNLFECVKYAVNEAGIPLEMALASATMVPARELGIYDMVGSITVGKKADFVLIDKDLNIKEVYVGGRKIR